MLPELNELLTESDVEQKLLWSLLTTSMPQGLGFASADIFTKLNVRRLEIGKGASRKIYFPDYLIVLAGLPVMVVEAKARGQSLVNAYAEARLYANELNAQFPHQLNPCSRIIACNGDSLWAGHADTLEPVVQLSFADLSAASVGFAQFVDEFARPIFQQQVDELRRTMRSGEYRRAVTLVGGTAFQNEELAQNTFGATIVGDYGHIFNPKSRDDRARIAREAYIPSLRRQRYVEPIDRLIRNAVAPSAAKVRPLEDSSQPIEITTSLRDRQKLENQILLLVGSVGAGKSTFIDYLSLVALPKEIRDETVWLRLNLNEAPLDVAHAYQWVARGVVDEFRSHFPDIDFDKLATLDRVFGPEINALKKGPLAVLEPSSTEFKVRIADRLLQLQNDALLLAKGIAKYICGGRNLLLVIVLDNCDKRTRDEQLTMFQIAHWLQGEFRCLIVLPLRDVTYDMHRRDPPLDTALKQFVFRIEPPKFSEVLQARVKLALNEMSKHAAQSRMLSYQLPNGFRVMYPAEDQALYLASILRSLYAHDRFVRQVITGIAGRDVRLALEMFMDFCISGHIGEDEIYKIRFFEGQYVLPLSVVARVLLRMQRRFYDGNASYIKNIVQCDPADPLPDHFVRLAILKWFEQRLKTSGPAGVEGFHRNAHMVADLAAAGHDAARVREELVYLVREGCVVPEHLRSDSIADDDLVKITASGVVHLQLMVNPEYLAACSEDTWVGDGELCSRLAARIGAAPKDQFSPLTTARNAADFVDYLRKELQRSLRAPEVFLNAVAAEALGDLTDADVGAAAAEVGTPERLFIGGIHFGVTEEELLLLFSSRGIGVRSLHVPRSQADPARNRGFAFMIPATGTDALAAIDLDRELVLRDRRLRISEAHPLEDDSVDRTRAEHLPPLTTRVYVGHLPRQYSKADVRALLASHDLTAVDVYVLVDKDTQRSKGACFVELQSLDDAAQTIGALNDLVVEGRKLVVKPATPRENHERAPS